MAAVTDTWHVLRLKKADAAPCVLHPSKTPIYPSATHGVGKKRWQVRYRDANNKQIEESYSKKAAADARAAQIENELNRGLYVDRAAGRETFRAYAEKWLGQRDHDPSTQALYRRLLRLHILPLLGEVPLGRAGYSDASGWVSRWDRTLGANLSRQCQALTQAIFNTAVLDDVIPKSPFRKIKLPQVQANIERYFPEELAEVVPGLAVLPPDLRVIQTLVIGSGMRLSEVLGLDADQDLNFPKGEVSVRRQLVCIPGGEGGLYWGAPKTMPESRRTIPLPPFATDVLAEHLAANPPAVVELPWGDLEGAEPLQVRAVFHNGGKPVLRTTVTNRIRYHLGKANLEQGTTPHVLRHLYESMLHDAGVPQIVIDTFMGHRPTGSMGRRGYQHVMRGAAEKACNALEAEWGRTHVPEKCPKVIGPASDLRG